MRHEPIGMCVIVLDKSQKKVLLGRRLNCFKAGLWGLPGGRLEAAETLAAGAVRELREETSLVCQRIGYVGVVREWQEEYNFIHFVYQCDHFEGQPKRVEPEKCEGWKWFELDSLPHDMLPGHWAAIHLYLEKKGLKEIF